MVIINNKPWADRPFNLLSPPKGDRIKGLNPKTVEAATFMSLAHNLYIRTLNAIYLQAGNVKEPTDAADFLVYCQIFAEGLHGHHKAEEEHFFPQIEEYSGQKGLMATNVAQHDAFEPGLVKFEEYVKETTPEDYDGKKLLAIIDDFGPVLTQHLTDEIDTLLALDKYGGDKLKKAWDFLDAQVLKEMGDMHRMIPAGLSANDKNFEGGGHKFPPFPFFVPYLAQFFFARKYKGAWRFGPCDMYMKQKELPFATEEK